MLAKELSSLRDQRQELKAEVEKYKECDPQVVEEIRKFVSQPERFGNWGARQGAEFAPSTLILEIKTPLSSRKNDTKYMSL